LQTAVFVKSLPCFAQEESYLITIKTINTLVKFDARFSYFTYDVRTLTTSCNVIIEIEAIFMHETIDIDGKDAALTDTESVLVRAAQRCIVSALDHSRANKIALLSDDTKKITAETPILELPPKVLRFVASILGAMAEGKTVVLLPKGQTLTTVQAAQFLNVSRPFLTKLLKEGKIPFVMVGSHRRIVYEDLVNYKNKIRMAQDEAMNALANQAQELGLV
jgi:excisionase family DNA binding protein